MNPFLFTLGLGLACGLMLAWGFRRLTGEGWQIMACLPRRRRADGSWEGLNLTWYGFFIANAQALAGALFLLLMASVGVAWQSAAGLLIALSALCLAGSRWLARVVEKKAHTFTVGGASFLGLLAAPLLVLLMDLLPAAGSAARASLVCWCAALTTAYALGEALGRLACISFGCCYGRALDQCAPLLRRLFAHAHFVFQGSTRKIAYASGMEGRPVVPIQALTAVVLLFAALAGTYLFLLGAYSGALLVSGVVTHGWRFFSEFLRADFRGDGRLSAYQKMAAVSAVLIALLAWVLPLDTHPLPELGAGLKALWSPGPSALVAVIWLVSFYFYGRSRVTVSSLRLSVAEDRI